MPNFRGTPRAVNRVIALGTSTVTTGTHLVGFAHVKGRIKAVRFGGQGAVTGTSLTAEVKKVSADGDTSTSLQSAAKDIKLTTSTDETELEASLSTTAGALDVLKGQLFEVVITADSVTAGPGDVVVEVEIEPRA